MKVARGRCRSSHPRSVPDHDELDAGDPGDLQQASYALLRREPADVADDHALSRPGTARPLGVQRLVALTRAEQVEVDAPAPQVQVAHAEPLELAPGSLGRHEGAVGPAVQVPDPGVQQGAGRNAVPTGEPGHVGLVHRKRRCPDPPRGLETDGAQRDR